MKWIKTAIGAVIAVLSIGIIATTVFKMTQPREVIREVSFEIDSIEGKYYPLSAYNEILEYGVINENRKVINIVSFYVNDEISDNIRVNIDSTNNITLLGDLPDLSGLIASRIDADGNWFDNGSDIYDNVDIKLVFEVIEPPQLTGINATLILLIPLVFVGGLLLYFYKPLKKD